MRDVKELSKMAAVEPYRFEPERAPDENQAPDREDDNGGPERLINVNWCTCGRRETRETARECICCLEEPESENKFAEGILSILYFSALSMHSQLSIKLP